MAERVRYDAYGNARHHHGTDADGDGDADGADFDLITALIGGGDVPITNTLKYRSELDVNRDGVIDADDGQIVKKAALAALPEGEVSAAAGPDSPVGYCGYLFNAETGLYTVRFRWYSPGLGRFISRDPLGYVDGMGLYEYGQGSPVGALDPMGLSVAGGLADRLSGGGASTEQLQASRDDGCGKIRQAYLEGTICKKKFDDMWKTFDCGKSVAGEILVAAAKGFGEGALEAATDPHTILDAIGMIPVIGEVADGINALLYYAKGDYVNAGLSLAAMTPIGGIGVTAAKLGIKAGIGVGAAAGSAVASAASSAARKIPNRWGRRGSPPHQARVGQVEAAMQQTGWRTVSGGSLPERMDRATGRYPDLVMQRNGQEIAFQVERTTIGGKPVSRERAPLRDLRGTGRFRHVFFIRY